MLAKRKGVQIKYVYLPKIGKYLHPTKIIILKCLIKLYLMIHALYWDAIHYLSFIINAFFMCVLLFSFFLLWALFLFFWQCIEIIQSQRIGFTMLRCWALCPGIYWLLSDTGSRAADVPNIAVFSKPRWQLASFIIFNRRQDLWNWHLIYQHISFYQ